MAFWRTWVRALLGASGVTLLVPVGLVLTVALAATLGGAGLGGLGQLVSGPVLPGAEASAGLLPPTPSTGGVAALPTGRASTKRRGTGARTHSRTPSTQHSSAGTKQPGPSLGLGRKPSPPAKHEPTPAPTKPAPPTQPSSPIDVVTAPVEAVTKPVQSTLQRIGAAVEKTVSAIPVIGPPVADAVGTVVDLLSGPLPQRR